MKHRRSVIRNVLRAIEHVCKLTPPVLQKLMVEEPSAFVWRSLHKYLPGRIFYTISIFEYSASNGSIVTILI